jgi:hypothetical protein
MQSWAEHMKRSELGCPSVPAKQPRHRASFSVLLWHRGARNAACPRFGLDAFFSVSDTKPADRGQTK